MLRPFAPPARSGLLPASQARARNDGKTTARYYFKRAEESRSSCSQYLCKGLILGGEGKGGNGFKFVGSIIILFTRIGWNIFLTLHFFWKVILFHKISGIVMRVFVLHPIPVSFFGIFIMGIF